MLRYVANMGTIPIHVWSARVPTLERPDWLVLDLDPKGAPFTDVVRVAQAVHQLLDDLELPSYVKTSGATGLHVLVPARRPVHARAGAGPSPGCSRRWSSRRCRTSRPWPARSAPAAARCTSTSARTATAARSPRRSRSGRCRAPPSRARSTGGRSPRGSIRPASRSAPCRAASRGARTRWRRSRGGDRPGRRARTDGGAARHRAAQPRAPTRRARLGRQPVSDAPLADEVRSPLDVVRQVVRRRSWCSTVDVRRG